MKREQITPQMRKLMSPADHLYYSEGEVFHVKHAEPKIPRLEREEHGIFENWLISHGYAYRHSRTDKPTRELCGAPDFTVYQKRGFLRGDTFYPMASLRIVAECLAVEFKLPGNKLSKAQEEWAAKYGGVVHVLASAQEAIELVRREFGE